MRSRGEGVDVGQGRRLRGFVAVTGGGGVPHLLVGHRFAHRGGVGRHPGTERGRSSDLVACFGHVVVDDPVDVAVKLGAQRPTGERAHPREPGADDFVGVLAQGQVSAAADGCAGPGEQLGEAHGRLAHTTLRQRHWAHSRGDDPPRAGVGHAA